MEKLCLECKADITGTHHAQQFCSRKCRDQHSRQNCCICGKLKLVNKRNEDGTSICNVCWAKENKEVCSICGKNRAVNKRDSNGNPLCSVCDTKNNQEKCSLCFKERRVAKRELNGDAICHQCYNENNKEKCSICLKIKPVSARDGVGNPICGYCRAQKKAQACFYCGKIGIVSARTDNGGAVCSGCRRRLKLENCSLCGELDIIARRSKSGGAVCSKCSSSLLEKEECFICKKKHIVDRRLENGFGLCSGCSKIWRKSNYDLDLAKKAKISYLKFHHLVFESIFDGFEPEKRVGTLIDDGIIKDNGYNRLLRYDYYHPIKNILIELNEPVHYDCELFMKKFSSQNEKDFERYCSNFEEKIKIANENNIKLLIIDIEYFLNYNQIEEILKKAMEENNAT